MGEGEGWALPLPFFPEEVMRQRRLPFVDKRIVVHNMSQGDSAYQKLLDGLSDKELRILWRYPDLIEKVREIVKMPLVQIVAELQEEFSLEIEQYPTDNVWISTEKLEDAIPDWFTSSHCGWFTGTGDPEFLNWARDFLMQEVRINLWIKYLEYKKDFGKGWIGSGGNYV